MLMHRITEADIKFNNFKLVTSAVSTAKFGRAVTSPSWYQLFIENSQLALGSKFVVIALYSIK